MKKLIIESLKLLYENDEEIMKEKCSERNRVFHFANYFIDLCKNVEKYKKLKVDCEYNRNCDNQNLCKEIFDGERKRLVFPDFIFHKRGFNDCNMLVIEFKNDYNYDRSYDREKLKYFVSQSEKFKYKLGAFIIFTPNLKDVKLTFFFDEVESQEIKFESLYNQIYSEENY